MPPIPKGQGPLAASTCGHWQPYPRATTPEPRICPECRTFLRFDEVRCFWVDDEEAMETHDQIRMDAEKEG
jgi:hypothetical protein